MSLSAPFLMSDVGLAAQHLIFSLQGSLYAVAVQAVNAIVWLPALTPLDETPPFQAGVFNLRGQIVPVIDLAVRLGHAPATYGVMDCVIVLAVGDRVFGVIANEVLEVLAVTPVDGHGLTADEGADLPPLLVWTGQVVGDGRIVMGLDLELLSRGGDSPLGNGRPLPPVVGPTLAERFCPQVKPEESGIFNERARRLMLRQDEDTLRQRLGVAVVCLGQEFFGVALDRVREFAEAGEVVPVPCAPAHIVGSINHRGNVVTLIDIGQLLDMPPAPALAGDQGKVIIVEVEGQWVGIRVTDIRDIVYVDPASLSPLPAVMAGASGEYLQGEVPYEGRMLTLLDLQRILTSRDLLVEQTV